MTLFDGGYGRFVKFKTETLCVSTLCPTICVQHILVKAQLLDIYKQRNRWNSDIFIFSNFVFDWSTFCRTLVFKVYILFISQHNFAYFLFVLFHIFIKDNRMAHTKSSQWKLNALYLFSATVIHKLYFIFKEFSNLHYFHK